MIKARRKVILDEAMGQKVAETEQDNCRDTGIEHLI